MAKYHFHVDICSGGTGAAIAASSYQSGLTMRDELDHEKKYKNEERVIYTNLIAPDHAPDWAYDRQKLWQVVERREGVRGQYARKYNIALPSELNVDQQIELADHIANYYKSRGMCVDYAVHQDLDLEKPADQHNTHLHLMTTMRQFNPDGTWAPKWRNVTVRDRNGKAICVGRDKNGRKRYKHVKMAINNWSERDELINQRKMVADLSNAALAKAGFSARVDHRSYKEQGVMLIPTKHLGHVNAARERRGIHTPVGDYNRAVGVINNKLHHVNDRITAIDDEIERIDVSVRSRRKQRNNAVARRRRRRNGRQQATISKQSFAAERVKMYYMHKRLVATHDIANRSFAASKPNLFVQSKCQRAELERRRPGQDRSPRLSKLQLMTWHNLKRDERRDALAQLNNMPAWRNTTDAQKARFGKQSMFAVSADRRQIALYPLGRDISRHKPGDKITTEDMYNDCRAAYNAAGGLREAGQSLKAAADSITSALDPKKSSWQHVKAAASDVKAVVTAPVTIAKDIISNPLTGLLKAPLRALAAGAKTTSATINVASAVGKGGDGGRARARDKQSSR